MTVFAKRHERKLRHNQRMEMQLKNLDRLSRADPWATAGQPETVYFSPDRHGPAANAF